MRVLYPRCGGLDLHKKTMVACVLLREADGAPRRVVRTYGTMTADLGALGDGLQLPAVTHVARERTGVLWRPVFKVLGAEEEEEGRTLMLVTAWLLPSSSTRCPGAKRTARTVSGWPTRHAPWPAHGELRPPARDPHAARSHAVAQDARPRGAPKRATASTTCWRPLPASWGSRQHGGGR